VVIIKPADSAELFGGYNPLSWTKHSLSCANSNTLETLKDCFVFSLAEKGNDNNGNDKDIVSRVLNPKEAIYCNVYCSPVFGKGDLFPKGHFEIGQPCGCKQTNYDKSIRSSAEQFTIEEFEVFQIVPKSNIKN